MSNIGFNTFELRNRRPNGDAPLSEHRPPVDRSGAPDLASRYVVDMPLTSLSPDEIRELEYENRAKDELEARSLGCCVLAPTVSCAALAIFLHPGFWVGLGIGALATYQVNRMLAANKRRRAAMLELQVWERGERINYPMRRLTEVPNEILSRNSYLEELILSHNYLGVSPNVSQNVNLRVLNLADNELRVCPNLQWNAALSCVDLSCNYLETLDDSILSLPRNCTVNVERNEFSYEYIQTFMARLHSHQAIHSDQGPNISFSIPAASGQTKSLEEEIHDWIREFSNEEMDIQENFGSLLSMSDLDQEAQLQLAQYLHRLREIKDYKTGGAAKNNVIKRVKDMLQLANSNKEFRNDMIACISEGLDSCGDRVAIIFNDIEILSQFHNPSLSEEEIRSLAIRAERYRQAQRIAKEQCAAHHLGDQIETILYVHMNLKESLQLPITMTSMLYPKVSGVTPKMLAAIEREVLGMSEAELLARSDYWQAYQKRSHFAESEAINNTHYELLEDLEKYLNMENKEEQKQFLEKHLELQTLIEDAEQKGKELRYDTLVKCIQCKREEEIARL
ncbi:MAG TPA: NEL-type E3 ubiquitin ligase domain-containing protein [Chlamydiales bacterium]|nr:NEL-type E3 ubiquitin ligase domain-containing protein [Chlamydiales bacterium]